MFLCGSWSVCASVAVFLQEYQERSARIVKLKEDFANEDTLLQRLTTDLEAKKVAPSFFAPAFAQDLKMALHCRQITDEPNSATSCSI